MKKKKIIKEYKALELIQDFAKPVAGPGYW